MATLINLGEDYGLCCPIFGVPCTLCQVAERVNGKVGQAEEVLYLGSPPVRHRMLAARYVWAAGQPGAAVPT